MKSGLKDPRVREGGFRVFVATIAAMKSGLKVNVGVWQQIIAYVATIAAMKSGLKELHQCLLPLASLSW